jgi:hypothetical protein
VTLHLLVGVTVFGVETTHNIFDTMTPAEAAEARASAEDVGGKLCTCGQILLYTGAEEDPTHEH